MLHKGEAEAAILNGRVPGVGRRWESKGFFAWDRAIVRTGQVKDGECWYVERLDHPRTGPYRAELYDTEAEALTVAEKVMRHSSEVLDGRAFTEF